MNRLIVLILIFAVNNFSQIDNSENWIDLSYTFDDQTVYWPTNETYKMKEVFKGINDKGFYYSSNKFCAEEHGGTHLDAPIHFAENRKTADEIPLSSLIGNAIVVDVSERALANRDYLVSVDDFLKWEEKHGEISDEMIVLIRTGYGKFYPDKKKYLGTELKGTEGVANLHFPGLDPKAAEWLVNERNIKAIGLDTPSIDYGQSTEFMAHRILCEKEIPIFENVANLDKLPGNKIYVIALPMKIKDGSGGPLRIIAKIL